MSIHLRRDRLIFLAVMAALLIVFSAGVQAQDESEPLNFPPLEWLDMLTLDNFGAAEPVLTITGPNAYSAKMSEDQRYFQYYTYVRESTRWGPMAYEYTTLDTQTYEQVSDSLIHAPNLYYVDFDHDAETITRYDTATGEEAEVLFTAPSRLIYPYFIDEGNVLYTPQNTTCGSSSCIRWLSWDINTGEPGRKYVYGATNDNFRWYTPMPDSDRILASYCAEYNKTMDCLKRVVEVFSMAEGQVALAEFDGDTSATIQLTPDPGKVLLRFRDYSAALYDVNTLEPIMTLPDAIYTAAFSPDGSLLAAGTLDGKLILYETENYTEVSRWTAHRYAVIKIVWHQDGQILATGGGLIASRNTPDLIRNRGDSVVNVWDVNTGTHLNSYDAGTTTINSVYFSPDGRFLLIAAGPTGEDGSGGQVTFVGLIGDQACRVQSDFNANLRSGPGTSFGVAGGLSQGQSTISDRTESDGEGYVWWHLVGGGWIREDLATPGEHCDNLPGNN